MSDKVKTPFDQENEIKPVVVYVAIVNQGNANAVIEIFRRAGSNASFVKMGRGTATKQVREILGIEDNRKEIVISLIGEDKLKDAVTEFAAFVSSSKRNQGIGFSIPLTSVAGVRMYHFLANI